MNQSALIPVSFREATLFVVDHEGQPFVPMKPVVEGMGLDWKSQYGKFKENQQRWGMVLITIPSQGGEQSSCCLPLRKINGWLMTIQPSRVKPEIKDTIIAYQNECDEVLWQHWNNRFTIPQSYSQALRLASELQEKLEQRDVQIAQQSAQLQDAQPKVQFYDQVVYKEPLLDKAQLFSLLKTKTGQTFNEQTFLNFLREIGAANKVNPYKNIGYKRFVPKSEYIDYWFVAQIGEDGHTEWFYRNIIVADLVAIIEHTRHAERAMVQASIVQAKQKSRKHERQISY